MPQNSKNQPLPVRRPISLERAGGIIWESAIEAFSSAFLVWIIGGVALSIAGSFSSEMIPSPPPFLAHVESNSGGFFESWGHLGKSYAFACFFAVFFAHSLWAGFSRARASRPVARAAKRLHRILSTLRDNWFGLIVGNAIGAYIGALALVWVQNFSLTQIIFHEVLGFVLPTLQTFGRVVLGVDGLQQLGNWFSWYGDNQTKLTFWLLYAAGVFDDLGVPNFKALARRTWRRRRKSREMQPATAVEVKDHAGPTGCPN